MGEGGGGVSEIYLREIGEVLKKITVHWGGGAGKLFLILLNFPPAHPYV